jgi:thiamine-phosphate pyrophosphorylase
LLDSIRRAIDCGADWIQIREKHLPARELLSLSRDAVAAAHNASRDSANRARVIVNDRLDVALAAGASGVHLGSESIPVASAVEWLRSGKAPTDFAVGASSHGLDDARSAERAGASYIFFGPVFDTPSKRGFGAPQGLDRLSEVCAAVKIPVIAIGGVNEENAASCIEAGASGIAAIRLFQEASDQAALRAFIAKLHAL